MGLSLSVPLIANEAINPIAQDELTSFSSLLGKGLLIGVGTASICAILYSRTIGPRNGIIDEAIFHEEHVVSRTKQTFYYWGGSLGIAAISCIGIHQLPFFSVSINSLRFASVCTVTIATLFSGVWVQGLPYKPELGLKHIAWVVHSAIIGALLAPLLMIDQIVIAKSAGVTLMLFGELTVVAFCSHHVTFLSLGLLVPISTLSLMLATIGSYIWRPSSLAGVAFHGLILHGGLMITSVHVLYDTQALAGYALWCNREGSVLFDPINASIDLFIDTVKIFLRVAAILCMLESSDAAPKSG